MELIVDLINSVGFPIFACIYLAKNNEKLGNSINELSLTLKSIDTRLQRLEQEEKKHSN